MSDSPLMQTPGGTLWRRAAVKEAAAATPIKPLEFPRMADEPTRRPEPITQAKFLGWIIAGNATLVCAGVTALFTVLWNQNNSMVRLTANYENFTGRFAALEAAVATGTQSRYTSSDAASDRASLIALLNTTRESWNAQWKVYADAHSEHTHQIDDLRQEVTRLKAMETPRKP